MRTKHVAMLALAPLTLPTTLPLRRAQAIYSTPAGGFVTAPANDESRFFQKAEAMVTTRFR